MREVKAFPAFKPLKTRQRQYLIAYAKTFSITGAAELSGVPWITHYSWLRKSEQYKEAFEFARVIAGDHAEGDVYERAFIGKDRKVTGRTGITEEYKDKSDVLAIFMLKGLKPQYRDNATINQFIGPAKINIGTPHLAQSTVIDITETGLEK